MSSVSKCDRCGKTYDDDTPIVVIDINGRRDLCDECVPAFEDFMKGELCNLVKKVREYVDNATHCACSTRYVENLEVLLEEKKDVL